MMFRISENNFEEQEINQSQFVFTLREDGYKMLLNILQAMALIKIYNICRGNYLWAPYTMPLPAFPKE